MGQTKERRKAYQNLCVEVPREFYDRIEEKAKSKSVSKSDIVRSAMREYLAN